MVKGDVGGKRGMAASRGPNVVRSLATTPASLSQRKSAAGDRGDKPSQAGAASSSQALSQLRREADESAPDDGGISREESDKLVAEVMRHMLFKNRQHPNVPVKRDELSQLVTKTYKQRQLTSIVISKAQKKLRTLLGFEMQELTRTRSSKALKSGHAQGPVDTKEYILKSLVPEELLKKHVETRDSAAVLSMALLVVCIIKFAGGENVPEDTLFTNLKRLGVTDESDHTVFGNVKDAVETVARQRYIQKEKLSGNDGEGFVYQLAERSLDESFRSRLEIFVSQMKTAKARRINIDENIGAYFLV